MKKESKKTFISEVYDEKYYTEFCRTPKDLTEVGGITGYRLTLTLLAPKVGDKILDIGCGRGEVVKECNAQGAYAVGMDYSKYAVRIAKENGTNIVRGSAIHLPFANEAFDKVSLMEIIEHLDDDNLNDCFLEVKRVLKNGGNLIITTPNSWNKILFFLVKLFNLVGIKIRWMSRDDPYHINIKNPLQLWRLLRKYGFRVKLFPNIEMSNETSLYFRLIQRLLFPVKHLRCVAQK